VTCIPVEVMRRDRRQVVVVFSMPYFTLQSLDIVIENVVLHVCTTAVHIDGNLLGTDDTYSNFLIFYTLVFFFSSFISLIFSLIPRDRISVWC